MLCKWNHIVGSLLGLGSFSLRIIPWTFDIHTAIFLLHISIACRIPLFLKNILFMAVLGLRCYAGSSLVGASRGYSPGAVCRLLTVVASPVVEHRF